MKFVRSYVENILVSNIKRNLKSAKSTNAKCTNLLIFHWNIFGPDAHWCQQTRRLLFWVMNYTAPMMLNASWRLHHQFLTITLSHYSDIIMNAMTSQITSLTIVYSTVYSGADQRKHQSFASLAFVRGIHRSPVNYPHKWPVTQEMFPFDDVIMDDFNAR